MSIAEQLGLGEDSPLLAQANLWWAEKAGNFAVVQDLTDLPAWTRQASRAECDDVLVWLAERAAAEDQAAVVLVWLLLPGAAKIADRHRDLSPGIDALVGGQLWIESRTHGGVPAKAVAFTILQRTKRAVSAELGVGDGARRQDRTWASTTVTDRLPEHAPIGMPEEPGAEAELRVVVEHMLRDAALTVEEVGILASAAGHADWLDAPVRGRAGVTTPAALEVLTWLEPAKARTMRRTVGRLLSRVADYARAHHTLQDIEALRAARDSEWTFEEFVMIIGDPDMAGRLRRFHRHMLLTVRCQAHCSVGPADESARWECAGPVRRRG
ncbi:MAG: hypothetical protein QM655_17260 [Nocardioidaceae bacterium]